MTEQDLILLNSYLDGQLPGGERDALEARLAREPQLKAELDSLQDTIRLLKMAERVPVPRNFTLDPAKYARRARGSWLDVISRNSPLVVAGAMVVAALVFIGGAVVILSPGRGGASVAMEAAPAAQAPAGGETLNFAAKATESAADAMTEAPSLAGGAPPAMVPLPTQASAGGPEVTVITQEAPPSLDAGQRAGGGGGGPGIGGGPGGGVAPEVPPAATEQYDASGAAGAANATEAASSGLSSYTATEEPEATSVAKADVREADPFGTLNRTGLILAIAIGVLAVLLTLAVVLLRRRRS